MTTRSLSSGSLLYGRSFLGNVYKASCDVDESISLVVLAFTAGYIFLRCAMG